MPSSLYKIIKFYKKEPNKSQVTQRECVSNVSSTSSNITEFRENRFNWTSEEQGLVLGSFFYGYCITQVTGGWAADKYSPKVLNLIGVGGTAVLSLLTPLSTRAGIWGIVTLRAIMGMLSGVAMESVSKSHL